MSYFFYKLPYIIFFVQKYLSQILRLFKNKIFKFSPKLIDIIGSRSGKLKRDTHVKNLQPGAKLPPQKTI